MARRADHGTADPTRRAVTTIQGTSLVGTGAGCHPFSRVPVPTFGCGRMPPRVAAGSRWAHSARAARCIRIATSVRDAQLVRRSTSETYMRMVLSLRSSSSAMSLFVRASAMRSRTRRR